MVRSVDPVSSTNHARFASVFSIRWAGAIMSMIGMILVAAPWVLVITDVSISDVSSENLSYMTVRVVDAVRFRRQYGTPDGKKPPQEDEIPQDDVVASKDIPKEDVVVSTEVHQDHLEDDVVVSSEVHQDHLEEGAAVSTQVHEGSVAASKPKESSQDGQCSGDNCGDTPEKNIIEEKHHDADVPNLSEGIGTSDGKVDKTSESVFDAAVREKVIEEDVAVSEEVDDDFSDEDVEVAEDFPGEEVEVAEEFPRAEKKSVALASSQKGWLLKSSGRRRLAGGPRRRAYMRRRRKPPPRKEIASPNSTAGPKHQQHPGGGGHGIAKVVGAGVAGVAAGVGGMLVADRVHELVKHIKNQENAHHFRQLYTALSEIQRQAKALSDAEQLETMANGLDGIGHLVVSGYNSDLSWEGIFNKKKNQPGPIEQTRREHGLRLVPVVAVVPKIGDIIEDVATNKGTQHTDPGSYHQEEMTGAGMKSFNLVKHNWTMKSDSEELKGDLQQIRKFEHPLEQIYNELLGLIPKMSKNDEGNAH